MRMRATTLLAARTTAFLLVGAFVSSCSGASRLVPVPADTAAMQRAFVGPDGRGVRVLVRMRIAHRERHRTVHPSTISPLTRSVSIAVDTAKARIFNAAPSSPGCTAGKNGTTCTFAVAARAGKTADTFTVTTYSALNGGGTALDRGVATVAIKKGRANTVAVTLGPVVTTTADTGAGSLRYAIGSANSGDTIMFLLKRGATITLTAPITIDGNVTLAGPGAAALAISGGGTHQLFEVLGTATISGLTLTHGKAAVPNEPGGTIFNGGTLTLTKDVVGDSTSVVEALRQVRRKARVLGARGLHPHCTTTYSQGGAIFNLGVLTTSSTAFSNNVVRSDLANCVQAEGGAIFNEGTLSSTGDTFEHNSALNGGAIYNLTDDATTISGDTFTQNSGCIAATGCPTSGCNATSCTSFAQGLGSAISDRGIGMTIADSTFTGNVAGGKTEGSAGIGGAIYFDSTLPAVTNSTFTGNLAGGGTSSCSNGNGGAIYAAFSLELDNDAFKNNAASGDESGIGGAVSAQQNLSGTGDTFTGNTAVGSGQACTTGAGAEGGAVFGTAVTLAKSTFTNNHVSANEATAGAAIAATTVAVTGCTFTSNTALTTGAFGATGAEALGAAVYALTAAKVGSSTFTSNTATLEGPSPSEVSAGAVLVMSGTLTSSGSAYKSNVATEKEGSGGAAGGAIASLSSLLTSNSDTFTSNSANGTGLAFGGAIYTAGGAEITNATISSNTASGTQGLGGGIALASLSGSMLTHVTLTKNSATGSFIGAGGAIYDTAGAEIVDSTLAQNRAKSLGGAMYASSLDSFDDSTVIDNSVTTASLAGGGGGGLSGTGVFELDNTTIAGNTVSVSGPGPAGGGGILGGGILMIDSTISGNKVLGTATSGGGGGILLGAGSIITNSTISNNASSLDGGGVLIETSGSNTFGNVTLYGNTAAGKGGNLDNLYTIALTNGIAGGGQAGSGRDVYNAPAATVTSNGYNIFGSAFAGGGAYTPATGDKVANPNVLPLSNNGGPTFTNADRLSSPGRAYIPYSGGNCGTLTISTDQRGFTRGAGNKCDAGAYEYAGVATAIRHRRPVRRTDVRWGAGPAHRIFATLPRFKPLAGISKRLK